jgi:hypothetical protein
MKNGTSVIYVVGRDGSGLNIADSGWARAFSGLVAYLPSRILLGFY